MWENLRFHSYANRMSWKSCGGVYDHAYANQDCKVDTSILPKPGRYIWNCVISISQARNALTIPLKNYAVCSIRMVVSNVSVCFCIYVFHSCQSSEIGGEPSSGLMLPPKHASKTCRILRHSSKILTLDVGLTLQQKQQHQECDLGKA